MRLRIKNVHVVRAKGRTYYYHRQTRKRITAEVGTAAFFHQVAQEDEKWKGRLAQRGSFDDLCRQYRASAEFTTLMPRTRRDYERVILWLIEVVDVDANVLDTPTVVRLRDRAFKEHGRSFANYVISVLSLIYNWGRSYGYVQQNPAHPVKKVKRPKDAGRANRPWSEAERVVVLGKAPPQLVLPIALAMFAALRQSDVIRLAWGNYDGQFLAIRQAKTGDPVWIPVREPLRSLLDRSPRVSTIVCVNARGTPWTQNGLRASFFKLIVSLEAEGLVGPGLTFHGLRHSVATDIAERGGGDREIAAVLGHRTNAMASHYSRDADRRRLAAMAMRRLQDEIEE